MINNRKVLAIIPAREGSKGIKNKNIMELNGKPLVSYTIEAANRSKYIDYVMVSTDGEKIAEISREYGAHIPFMRPKQLALDTSKTVECIVHSIEELKKLDMKYDVLALLQPTSPLRTADDIDRALEIFEENGEEGVVSVREVSESPILMRSVGKDGRLVNLINCNSTIRRQDMPKYYKVDGAIVVHAIEKINLDTSFNDNPIPCFMEVSHAADIDKMEDAILAEYYLRLRH